MGMAFEGLESFYEALAVAIDEAGPSGRDAMLTRLALVLANELGDPDKALAAIAASLKASEDPPSVPLR
jgi:hypothetical protein